jgi:hypothetical protein
LAIKVILVGAMQDVPKIRVLEVPTSIISIEGLVPLYTTNLTFPTIETSILGKLDRLGLKKKHMTNLIASGHENDPTLEDLQGTNVGGKKCCKPNELELLGGSFLLVLNMDLFHPLMDIFIE